MGWDSTWAGTTPAWIGLDDFAEWQALKLYRDARTYRVMNRNAWWNRRMVRIEGTDAEIVEQLTR